MAIAELIRDRFSIVVPPVTRAVTNLGRLQPGARVNLELDVVTRLVARRTGGADPGLARVVSGLPWAGHLSGVQQARDEPGSRSPSRSPRATRPATPSRCRRRRGFVAVISATGAGGDRRAVAPGGIRVGEPLAQRPAARDVPLPVRRQHTQAQRAALVACESPFVRRWALFVHTSFPLPAAGGIVSYRIVSNRIAAR